MAASTQRVFILGAGASAPSGVPVIKGFFDAIEDSRYRNEPHFETFIRGWRALRPVHAKAQMDVQNIEEVLGAFELAELSGVELLEGTPTRELIDAARRVIGDVISERTVVGLVTEKSEGLKKVKGFKPISGYARLASHASDAGFITFNQDLLLEFALREARKPFGPGYASLNVPDRFPMNPVVLRDLGI